MLRVYLDETGHSADTAYVGVAGLLAEEGSWGQFETSWADALQRSGAPSLHMRELAHFRGPYHDWSEERRRALLTDAIAAIRSLRPVVFGAIMPMTVWRGLSEMRRKALVDPYCVCLQECVTGAAVTATVHQQVAHVYIARNTEFAPKAGLLWKALRRNRLIASLVQEACEFGDPATQLPLQAADLVAFELLQAAKARERGREPRRWPFLQLQECSHHFLFIDREYVELKCPSDEVLKGLPGLEGKNAPR